jgi:signal transduction histidine kinase
VRKRLLIAILALVAAALVLNTIGSVLLIHGASASTAEQELRTQASAVADLYTNAAGSPSELRVLARLRSEIRRVGDYHSITIITLSPDGTFGRRLPAELQGLDLQPGVLQAGGTVSGQTGDLVYALVPLALSPGQHVGVRRVVPAGYKVLLVATRIVSPPVTGFGWFALIAGVLLALAAGVAVWLSRRFSRPIVAAIDATDRIAHGDLDSRIPPTPLEVPELARLGDSINAMAAGLAQARDQQRQFLLSVSHDLRTPLTSIRGYAEAVAEGAAEDVPGAMSVIAAEANRLERLVGDLLDLARLGARRFSLHRTRLEIGDVTERTLDRFRPEASAAGLQLHSVVSPDAPLWAVTDGERLVQVLSNLVENAINYARTSVVVGAARDGERVVLWVADDGAGIAPDDQPYVFQPHFTSDRRVRRRSGTGLGLAIVAELVTAMGGGYRVESPPAGASHGTRMVIWLPSAGVDPRGDAAEPSQPSGSSLTSARRN